MDKKRATGRYYTRGNPFKSEPFKEWTEKLHLNQQTVIEPFAGSKSIPKLIRDADFHCRDWVFFDIEPGVAGILQRDTLTDFPKGFNVCITNPPWLARNSASRRGLPYPKDTSYDDLYKYALQKCLTNCGWIAAIIPEAFIRSGLFLERLSDFISLVPEKQNRGTQRKKSNHTTTMFEDTDHPVGLALFTPNVTSDVRVWRNNQHLGTLGELQIHLPDPSRNRNIRFNQPNGNLGLIAIDNTLTASIRFCPPAELEGYSVRYQGRSITKIIVPWKVNVESLNTRLINIRQKTHDVFLTAFKGLRRDGFYRRRLDWALARSIVNIDNPQSALNI